MKKLLVSAALVITLMSGLAKTIQAQEQVTPTASGTKIINLISDAYFQHGKLPENKILILSEMIITSVTKDADELAKQKNFMGAKRVLENAISVATRTGFKNAADSCAKKLVKIQKKETEHNQKIKQEEEEKAKINKVSNEKLANLVLEQLNGRSQGIIKIEGNTYVATIGESKDMQIAVNKGQISCRLLASKNKLMTNNPSFQIKLLQKSNDVYRALVFTRCF